MSDIDFNDPRVVLGGIEFKVTDHFMNSHDKQPNDICVDMLLLLDADESIIDDRLIKPIKNACMSLQLEKKDVSIVPDGHSWNVIVPLVFQKFGAARMIYKKEYVLCRKESLHAAEESVRSTQLAKNLRSVLFDEKFIVDYEMFGMRN